MLFDVNKVQMKMIMNTTKKNICQSCGMPMGKIADFGTEKDGSINAEYCHYCYQEGRFTDMGISLEEKIAKNISIATKMGMPLEEATNLAKTTLPKLKRWM